MCSDSIFAWRANSVSWGKATPCGGATVRPSPRRGVVAVSTRARGFVGEGAEAEGGEETLATFALCRSLCLATFDGAGNGVIAASRLGHLLFDLPLKLLGLLTEGVDCFEERL